MQSPISEMIKFIAEVELSQEDLTAMINKTIKDQKEYELEMEARRPTEADLNRRYTL